MERIVVVNWTILCLTILLAQVVYSISIHEADSEYLPNQQEEIDNKMKESFSKFASSVERKKRHSEGEFYENLQKDELNKLLMNAIRESPWIEVFTTSKNEGKRNVVNFTPRLGRESGEIGNELGQHDSNQWMQDSIFPEQILYQRSPPFAPRLGRNNPPSIIPRLGREINGKMSLS